MLQPTADRLWDAKQQLLSKALEEQNAQRDQLFICIFESLHCSEMRGGKNSLPAELCFWDGEAHTAISTVLPTVPTCSSLGKGGEADGDVLCDARRCGRQEPSGF